MNRHQTENDPTFAPASFVDGRATGAAVSRLGLVFIVLAGAATGIWFAVAPDHDLAVVDFFFDDARRRFPADFHPELNAFRDYSLVIPALIAGFAIFALTAKLFRPSQPLIVRGRTILLLLITLALGPGLLVNGVLKPFGGRPRPVQVVEFGGSQQFVAWWDLSGTCPQNCSFVSGEGTGAAWLLAPASVAPAPWRYAAIGAVTVYTAAVGVLRVAFGKHFVTDIVMAAVFMALIVWVVHGFLFRWRMSPSDAEIDAAIASFARSMRERFRRAPGQQSPPCATASSPSDAIPALAERSHP